MNTSPIKQMSSFGFREIDSWEKESLLEKFIPPNAMLIYSDRSDVILIAERGKGKFSPTTSISFLDRIVSLVRHMKKGGFKVFGRKMTITKDEAQTLANILNDQSKKLRAMSEMYKLIATTLLVSKDDFDELIAQSDKQPSNPFE